MNAFAAWGSTLLGLAVITTIAEMILPKGKTRNVIRSVIATVTVLTVVTPIPGLFKGDFAFDCTGGDVQTDGGYLEFVDDAKRSMIAAAAKEYLKSNGYDGIGVEVELSEGYSVRAVLLDFSQTGITENGEHINKSEIKGLIAEWFDIGEEAVMTYG